MMQHTLYDELDAIIDKIQEDLKPDQKSLDKLRDIRDRLPDEIEEVTVVTKNHILTDVLINGKPVRCYCVVPDDQLSKYLKQRGFENIIDVRKETANATIRLIREKHRKKTKATTKRSRKR